MQMRSTLAPLLFGLLAAWTVVPSSAGELDGITVIELSDREAGEAIRGHSRGSGLRLVTYLSADGAYAALSDKGTRHCMAPAQPGSYTGRRITFGLPADEATTRLVTPGICQPFTLEVLSNDKVRLVAKDNMFSRTGGPLDVSAAPISYVGEHRILGRLPLVALDWAKVLSSGLEIKGIPLGPLPAVIEHVNSNGSLGVRPRSPEQNAIQPVALRLETVVGGETTVDDFHGLVVRGARLNWPWDVLYQLSSKDYLSQSILTEVFENAAIQRFGPVTLREVRRTDTIQHLHWLLDLDGHLVPAEPVSTSNCLATFDLWAHEDLLAIRDDIGPWNCSLVLTVSFNGSTGAITQQGATMTSGYVLGLMHFSRRLRELDAALAEIERTRAHRPKL